MLSAKNAAKRLACAPDYVGKLCREGKLDGKRIDNAWYVSLRSLNEFEHNRVIAKGERAKELAAERRKENEAYRKVNNLPVLPPKTADTVTSQKPFNFAGQSHIKKAGVFALGASLLFASLVFAGAASSTINPQSLTAALSQVESPFFALTPVSLPQGTTTTASTGGFLSSILAYLFGGNTTSPQLATNSPAPSQPLPPESSAAPRLPAEPAANSAAQTATQSPLQTIVQNITQPVIEKDVVTTESGITQADLDTQLNELSNSLKQLIYQNQSAPGSLPSSGGYNNNIALSQIIDHLSNVTITGGSITGATLSNVTGDFTGTFTSTNTATSSFQGGIDLTSGCFSVNGVCIGNGAGTASATGTPGLIQFTDGAVLASDGSLSFSTTTQTLTTNNLAIAGGLTFTSGGFGNCTLKTNPSGTVVCGTSGGGGTDGNWVFFNNSGLFLATTTNQVLIGSTATTSLAALEVQSQGSNPAAYFNGAVGIGTTSPFATFAIVGNQFVSGNFTAANITATGTLSVSGLATVSNLFATGSTTLQNVTALNATTSQATTTNLAIAGISSALLKTLSNGAVVAAISGTDYQAAGNYATFGYLFPGNATSTQIAFNGGLTAVNLLATGSTTLQNFTAFNATTTNATSTSLFASTLGASTLGVNGSYFSSLLGTGLTNNAGVLTVSTTSLGLLGTSSLSALAPLAFNASTGAFSISQAGLSTNGYLSSVDYNTFQNKISSSSLSGGSVISYNSSTGLITTTGGTLGAGNYTFPSDVVVDGNATTTNLAITGVTSSLLKTLSNGAVVAAQAGVDYQAAGNYATFGYPFPSNATSTQIAFNGGLTATGATTTFLAVTGSSTINLLNLSNALGVGSGGTGTSSAPSYGQLLLGNNAGGYSLVSTSSLGIVSSGNTTPFGQTFEINNQGYLAPDHHHLARKQRFCFAGFFNSSG